MTVGAAALTQERAEAALADLVKRGQVSREEGRAAMDRLMRRARTEGTDPRTLVSRLPDSMKEAIRDAGLGTGADLDDIKLKLAEIDHRLRLLEEQATGEQPTG
jgi:polyhydroxyalkanoate synthesis regulator phasin